MAVKNRLKEILDERGIKQKWLAEKVELQKSTISNIVSNRFNTNVEIALKIAQVLDVKVEDIWKIE